MENNEPGSETAILDSAGTFVHEAEENILGSEQLAEVVKETHHLMSFEEKLGITVAIVAGQALLIWFIWFLFKKMDAKIKAGAGNRIKPLTIRNLKILTVRQIEDMIVFLLKIAKYLITIFQLFITVPIVFSLYPATEKLASTIFGYIISPLKKILWNAVRAIRKKNC